MKFDSNKIILFLCSFTLYLFHNSPSHHVLYFLFSICVYNLILLFRNPNIKVGLFLIHIGFCFFIPREIFVLPLFLYVLPSQYNLFYPLLILITLIYSRNYHSTYYIIFLLLFIAIAYLLKSNKRKYHNLLNEYNISQVNSIEFNRLLESKNQTLLENKDYEVSLATLNERNRISKELHDNIGHLLSRSLLMLGALLTISKDKDLSEGLSLLKDNISDGMTNVRNSIHNMHDESIDLYTSLETMTKEFTFSNIKFEYDLKNNMNSKLKYSIIAIIKEGLSNIIKHSNCNNVTLILREHPAMYQLILSDNGIISSKTQLKLERILQGQGQNDSMGIQNIIDRTKAFQGNINFNFDQGFRIFISIPKELTDEYNHN